MKHISVFVLGFATALASAAAPAQDLTAGKTPAQLFRSDCAECHRSPGGVARTRDVHALAAFLREHYTTKSETAGALAAYVSSFAVTGPAVHNRGIGIVAPANGEPPPAGRRNRAQRDAAAADDRSNTSSAEATAPRRRRGSASGDGETPGAHNDGEAPRPPGAIARTRDGEPRDADAPPSRLRSRLPSGHVSESANADPGKPAAPKVRKRRNRMENAEPPAPAQTKTNADMPAAVDPAAPGPPRDGTVSPPPAPPAPTSPRVEQ